MFDTGLVFLSRWRRGQSFLKGGVDHLSHRLLRHGLGRYGVPYGIGLLGTGLGCAALLVMHSDFLNSLAIQITVGLAAIFILIQLEFRSDYEFRTGIKIDETQNTGQIGPDR
jgi:hypothetical protein